MNTQNPPVRLFLALALLLPSLGTAGDNPTAESTPMPSLLDAAPQWGTEPMLLAGTGMRGRSKNSSSIFRFGKRLPKEDGKQFVDPDFADVVGPAGRVPGDAAPSPVTTTAKPATKANQPAAKSRAVTQTPSNKAAATAKAQSKKTAQPAKKTVAKQPGPSVEELLKEMYQKDGREMPDMEYQPIAADNPAVRAARVKRGLPAVPSKKPLIETVPVSDLELSLDAKGRERSGSLAESEFFPADTTPAQPKQQDAIVFFPDDTAEPTTVTKPPTPEPQIALDLAPASKNVSEIFDLAPAKKPATIAATPKTQAAKAVEIEIPDVEIRVPTIPIPELNPSAVVAESSTAPFELPPAIDLPSLSPAREATEPATTIADASGWRASTRSTGAVVTADAEGWTSSKQQIARDPIGDAFTDDEQLVATNESLDIAPRALDVSEESADPLYNRESLTGLKGFCPVTLCEHRDLVDADPRYSVVYQDRTYYVSSDEALAQFRETPEKYAPVLGGLDVVRIEQDSEETDGILDYAAWYRGKLYLFESAKTLAVFSASPKTYAVE